VALTTSPRPRPAAAIDFLMFSNTDLVWAVVSPQLAGWPLAGGVTGVGSAPDTKYMVMPPPIGTPVTDTNGPPGAPPMRWISCAWAVPPMAASANADANNIVLMLMIISLR